MYKKTGIFLLILFYGIACTASAASAKPVITADTTYYDTDSGLYILKGHVRVEVGNRIITAGQAKVSLGSLEVWGSDGITLTQEEIFLTAGSIYVIGSQNKAFLSNGVTLSQPQITITADTANFNWRSKLAVFSGNVQVTQGNDTWTAASVTYNSQSGTLE